METHLTVGVAALRIGVQHHHVLRLIKREAIPFTRAGRFHLIAVADLPTVRVACVRAGYLRNKSEVPPCAN